MGFHKRYIDNKQVISLYQKGGVSNVIRWYTGKVDALILEAGLASRIQDVLNDADWEMMGIVKRDDYIETLIHQELGIEDIST